MSFDTMAQDTAVQKIFSTVPKTYELVNHLLTFGLDIIWRKKAARIAAQAKGEAWIDMCSGTGETAVYLSLLAPRGTKVFALDFSEPMLAQARQKPEADKITFVTGDVKKLPFEDNTFDVITISFATRNINITRDSLIKSFSEFYRVLKPGGCFVNLETSKPESSLVRLFFRLYIKLFVEFVGGKISGAKTAYAYLANTIPGFYSAEELAKIMCTAGFNNVVFQKMLFGTAAIHTAFKK